MDDAKDQNMQNFLITVGMFAVTPVIAGFFTFLAKGAVEDMIRNVVVGMAGAGILLYMMEESRVYSDYMFGNEQHYLRLFIFYTLGLVLACASSFIPEYLHPFAALAVLYVLLTNFQIGLLIFCLFLVMGALLGGFTMNLFLFYFFTSLIGAVLFRHSDKNYKIALPLLITGSLSTVMTVAFVFLFEADMRLELLWNPFSGLILNLFLILVTLHVFGLRAVHRFDNKYSELNDPEHELLVGLKETDKKEYYQAVHTAYLSDKIARKLGVDPVLAKAGGYYRKIGILRGQSNAEESQEIGREYGFPLPLLTLIGEYGGSFGPPRMKESIVVLMSEAIVTSIMFLFEKEPDAELEYRPVIEVVFRKKMESGVMDGCGLTVGQFHKMKQFFMEEALYYDFLR